MKRKHAIKRENLTISMSHELKEKVTAKKNYSGYIVEAINEKLEREESIAVSTTNTEEVEIRNALKERDKLIESYGNKIFDVERVIRRGEDYDHIPIEDWRAYMKEHGVVDRNGYFEIYERYQDQSIWHDVSLQVTQDKDREHEAWLKHEVAVGITVEEAIKKVEAYRRQELDKKIQEKKAEKDAIKDDKSGAGPYMRRAQIEESIWELNKRFKEKTISYTDIMNALGVKYTEAYNNGAPALRREGYKII